jgi:2-polyprenyl-3-methyl-5-hydroxy-6-metoxy-1,4-benzoquinol methylase
LSAATYEIQTQPCPICYLCGARGELLYERLEDRLFGVPGKWTSKQCPNPDCSLVWLDPMPVEEDIGKLYLSYLTHAAGSPSSQADSQSFRKKLGNALLSSAFGYESHQPPYWLSILGSLTLKSRLLRERAGNSVSWLEASWGKRLIDVGCGNGEFLARMRALGWDVVGVEPDPQAAQIGRETYGLPVHSVPLEKAGFCPESFDAATMSHVIEHLRDPVSTLKAVNSLLKQNGRLIIHTPNLASLGHRWFRQNWRGLEPPRHLFLFAPRALAKMVEIAGFHVLHLKTIFIDSMWRLSYACKKGINPDSVRHSHAKLRACFFMLVEHFAGGWPFHLGWGEQLTLVAVKRRESL